MEVNHCDISPAQVDLSTPQRGLDMSGDFMSNGSVWGQGVVTQSGSHF